MADKNDSVIRRLNLISESRNAYRFQATIRYLVDL